MTAITCLVLFNTPSRRHFKQIPAAGEGEVLLRRTAVPDTCFCYSASMDPSDAFSEYYSGLIEQSYDCMDRIVINAYFPLASSGGGFRHWWRRLFGDDAKLDKDHIQGMAGDFSRRLTAFCAKSKIPLIRCEAGERKHEIARDYLPEDPNFRGLFLVLTAHVPAPVWEVHRNSKGQITNLKHRDKWPYVKHYYFHLIDPEWGHVTIRICGYPPFGAQIILNGHERVERKATFAQVVVIKEGNCFIEGSDFAVISPLAAQLKEAAMIQEIQQLCDRWIYSSCLCFALDSRQQQQTDFRYNYSLYQLELSRNFLFKRGTTMDEVYQNLIDRTRCSLDIGKLKTIFGTRHRPHVTKIKLKRGRRGPELSKLVQSPTYDLTVFKVRWGNLIVKIYDKSARVLRVEVIVQNAGDLRSGRLLKNWPTLLARMDGILIRFLNTVQVAHVSFLDEGTFDQWTEPTRLGSRRLAGLDLNKPRIRSVLQSLTTLSTKPEGFTPKDFAQKVREQTGWTEATYGSRQAAYDLAKIRGKQLVFRQPKSRRYLLQPVGTKTICAYLVLREKVIKPILAGATGKRNGRPPMNPHPLDESYLRIQQDMIKTLEILGFSA